MTSHDDAWMAGLFEGEGTIWVGKRALSLAVTSTDYDVLDTLLNVAGVGHISKEYRDNTPGHEHYKPHKKWVLQGIPECQALLRRMLPFLHARRKVRALEALALDPEPVTPSRPGRRGGKDPARLCRRGLHPMNGNRYCRECANEIRRKNKRWSQSVYELPASGHAPPRIT